MLHVDRHIIINSVLNGFESIVFAQLLFCHYKYMHTSKHIDTHRYINKPAVENCRHHMTMIAKGRL